MPGDLVFIDRKDDIAILKGLVDKNTIVICLQPSVGAELLKIGIQYESSVNFFGVSGHKSTVIFSDEIVESIRPLLKQLCQEKFCRTFEKNWVFSFRFYLNYWISTLHVVHLSVQKFQPDRLVVLGNSVIELSVKNSHNSSFLDVIVKHYADAHKIKTYHVDGVRKFKIYQLVKIFLLRLKHYFGILVFEFILIVYPLMTRKKQPILAPEDSYNMPRLLNEVSQHIKGSIPVYLQTRRINLINTLKGMVKGKFFSFYSIPVGFNLNKKNIFQDNLDSSTKYIVNWLNNPLNNTTIYGVDLSQPLSLFINHDLTSKMKDLKGRLTSLLRVLSVVQPKYVFAQHSLGISYALGEYCMRYSIPSLLISHGSHVPHSGEVAELEWSVHAQTIINSNYPFIALQTPWASKFFKEQKNVVSCGIETGPLLFSRKSDNVGDFYKSRDSLYKRHAGRKILLHASSPRDWKSLRPWVYETIDEYIRNINDLIKAVEGNKNLYLAIRFRPLKNLSLPEFKSLLDPSICYDIYTDGSFEEYLLSSDLLISYSSTTIEESLQNHIPVLQYDPDGKYIHIPGHKLPGRRGQHASSVYYVHAQNRLLESLKWWDDNHDNAQVNNWSKHIIDIDEDMTWIDSIRLV
jgi:hypothetical protein